jgi:hypothetical protein
MSQRGLVPKPSLTVRPVSRPASRPLVGSEVLEARGTNGVRKRAMHEPLRAPDDEVIVRHMAPGEGASVSFDVDPAMGDAAAELARDLGRGYLDGATGEVEDAGSDTIDDGEVTELDERDFEEIEDTDYATDAIVPTRRSN